MDNFVFHSPTKFIFGKGTEERVGGLLSEAGAKKVLIHYGSGSVVRSGLLARIKESLEKQHIQYVELGGVLPNPVDSLVYPGIDLCREENVDFVLAVGGGSTIDSSKAIALGVPYQGDFWDFFESGDAPEKVLPIATVLTIAAAGSEGSEHTVITRLNGSRKRGYGHAKLRPLFSILNPALTQTLPKNQTAAGAADIMAHIFERYMTNTKDVEVSDRLCEALLLTMLREVPRAISDPNNYEARANIMWTGMIAHNDLVGVGREQDWSSHAIEHELSALYGIAHGAGLAVVFPAWMHFVMKHDVARFAQLATRVFGCEMDYFHPENTGRQGIERLEAFFSSIDLPTRFQELGGQEKDIPYLAEHIGIGSGRLGYFLPLSTQDVIEIYKWMCRPTKQP